MLEKTLEHEGFTVTKKTQKTSIYILPNGYAIDGEFEYGCRTREHREIEAVLAIDRYHSEFWNHVFNELRLVLVEPESQIYMYPQRMELTKQQRREINRLRDYGYTYLEFS